MFKVVRLFIHMNQTFRREATEYLVDFPIKEVTLSDQEMDDIDHLWLGQPLF